MKTLTVLIDEVLPQTQCERCGYKGCAPYANAIATNHEQINLCIPGGDITVKAIAKITHQEAIPVISHPPLYKTIALIDEDKCIGCTICIKACPVDAIAGAKKLMHTVLTAECTGCELCIEPCPMQCISMVELPEQLPTWSIDQPEVQKRAIQARLRFNAKNKRLSRLATTEHKLLQMKQANQHIQEELKAAILRVKKKKSTNSFYKPDNTENGPK